jgi:hypothetical protein
MGEAGLSNARRLETYALRENILLSYAKPPIADGKTPEFETAYQAYHHRKTLAREAALNAGNTVLGEDARRFLDLSPEAYRQEMTLIKAGSGFVSSSNAGYFDPVERWLQDVGRAVHLTQQARRNNRLTPLQAGLAEIINTGDKELGAVLTFYRAQKERLALFEDRIVDYASYSQLKKLEERAAAGVDVSREMEEFTFRISQKIESPRVLSFLREYQRGHADWVEQKRVLAAASGRTIDWKPDSLYLPPIDTTKYPFVAFVKFRDGYVGGTSDVAMLTAKDAAGLQEKIKQVQSNFPQFDVLTTSDTADYYKARGLYEFQSSLNSPMIDSALMKKGILHDFYPVLEPKQVAEEFVKFIGRTEDNIVREAVQLRYADQFSELRWLSDQYTKVQKSKIGSVFQRDAKTISDPFGDGMRLALNVSKKAEYQLWHDMNEFVDALGTRAYSALSTAYDQAKKGEKTWEEANALLEKYGMQGHLRSQEDYCKRSCQRHLYPDSAGH